MFNRLKDKKGAESDKYFHTMQEFNKDDLFPVFVGMGLGFILFCCKQVRLLLFSQTNFFMGVCFRFHPF